MFNFIINPLLNILIGIYGLIPGHDFGLSVIVLTLVIRLILWPLTGKQLQSQKKMQQLQPDILKIRKQAAGDKQQENKLLMELYKEREINPFSACLPLLLQLPVLLALFYVFRKSSLPFDQFSGALYGTVRSLPYIRDVLAGTAAYHPSLLGLISMAKPSLLLAVIAGATQLVQVRMITPKNIDPEDGQAKMMASMNLIFPAVTFFIALSLPGALPLYWAASNGVAVLQQWLVMRDQTERMEEAVIVIEEPSKPKTASTTKKKTTKKKRKK